MANDKTASEVLKRPRPVVSCLNCRRKKLKCDRTLPCQQCTKSGISNECAYAPGCEPDRNVIGHQNAAKRRRIGEISQSSSPLVEVSSSRFDELQARVIQLEQALQAHQVPKPVAAGGVLSIEASSARSNRSVSSAPQNTDLERLPLACLSGQAVTQFDAIERFVANLASSDCSQELSTIATDIRTLHEVLRPPLMPILASYTDKTDVLSHMQHLLPDTPICQVLVDLYFEYFENCFRILHQQTTIALFEAFWNGTLSPDERNVCIPLLMSVISIASSLGTLSECHQPNLHGESDGIGAYQLIRNYLQLLKAGEWKMLPNIQIAVLSLGLHHSCPLQGTDIWLWSGRVIRRAMVAGIHDPSAAAGDLFETEIRRRLWLTILEQDLTISIASSMPPNCPSWQLPPPMSVDDAELYPGMSGMPRCRSTEDWTDGICQYALAQTFNDRLGAYSLIFSGKSISYAELLQQTRRLEQIIQDIPHCFRFGLPDDASNTPSRLVAQMGMDFIQRRPLNACYAPWAAQMPSNDRFKEARILWIQSCTFGACFQDLFDPKYPLVDLPHPEGLWDLYHFVYAWDNVQFLLANSLELQRLWRLEPNAIEPINTDFVNHMLRAKVKIPGWTIESIIKSIEEQIDAFIRRVGRPKSDLRVVVRWVTILGSLKYSPTCNQLHAMKNELQSLVAVLRTRFGQRCDAFRSQLSQSKTTWDDAHNRMWLQRYILEDIDDFDLDSFSISTSGEHGSANAQPHAVRSNGHHR